MQKEEIKLGTHVIDDYYMSADANQYILTKRVTRTSRKDQSQYDAINTLGYFGTVQALCKRIVSDHVRKKIILGEIPNLRAMVDEMDAITSRLESVIQF